MKNRTLLGMSYIFKKKKKTSSFLTYYTLCLKINVTKFLKKWGNQVIDFKQWNKKKELM